MTQMATPQDREQKPNPFTPPPKLERDWISRRPPPAQPRREWINRIRGKETPK
jgi:hypothetical protein